MLSLLAVIVLFNKSPKDCPALDSLRRCISRVSADVRWKILLYDNTPGGNDPGILDGNTEYRVAPYNHGLASAYNVALNIAESEGFDWLLTLDHDTVLGESFLDCVSQAAMHLKKRSEIAAIVPRVLERGVLISPHVLRRGFTKALPPDFLGVPRGMVAAVNSGTMWRVSALQEIGGCNPLFWLDYLDHWLFRVIQRSGKYIYVDGRATLEHQLSLLNGEGGVSCARLDNILQAASAFHDLQGTALERFSFTKWLFLMLCRLLVIRTNDGRSRVVWKCLKLRILSRRTDRIEAWTKSMAGRILE